jgi:hypothetical protein
LQPSEYGVLRLQLFADVGYCHSKRTATADDPTYLGRKRHAVNVDALQVSGLPHDQRDSTWVVLNKKCAGCCSYELCCRTMRNKAILPMSKEEAKKYTRAHYQTWKDKYEKVGAFSRCTALLLLSSHGGLYRNGACSSWAAPSALCRTA